MHPGESALDSDSESERAILDDEGTGITKTTKVTVLEETEGPSQQTSQESLQKQSHDWASPDIERGIAHVR